MSSLQQAPSQRGRYTSPIVVAALVAVFSFAIGVRTGVKLHPSCASTQAIFDMTDGSLPLCHK